jgi:hypothetical protein
MKTIRYLLVMQFLLGLLMVQGGCRTFPLPLPPPILPPPPLPVPPHPLPAIQSNHNQTTK